MSKTKSKRSINIRELKRTGDSCNSALSHIYKVYENYQARKEYEIKYFAQPNEHTLNMLAACDYMRDQIILIQRLVISMAVDIDQN